MVENDKYRLIRLLGNSDRINVEDPAHSRTVSIPLSNVKSSRLGQQVWFPWRLHRSLVRSFLMLLLGLVSYSAYAQIYRSYDTFTSFFSEARLEDIKADNKEGIAIFNAETGELAFSVPIKGFQFRKSLMQEHFNENYMESHKYPNATFKGSIINYEGLIPGKKEVVAERGYQNTWSSKGGPCKRGFGFSK